MSLDVYLTMPGVAVESGGIFIRENGQTKQISWEEWNERYPDREPVEVKPHVTEDVFDYNITHNLGGMAQEAGLYDAMWHPANLDPEMKARIQERYEAKDYHGPEGAFALERSVTIYARDLIQPLKDGLALLQAEPERFKAFNPDNSWGNYEGLVDFAAAYLAACIQYPDAEVHTST